MASTFTDLARDAFGFLVDRGFAFRADNSNLPEYDQAYFEKGRITVRVYWERRDGVVVTYLGRRQPLGLGVRELGLDFLDDVVTLENGHLIHDQADERLGTEVVRQAELLRSRGEGLLMGERGAWRSLADRQRQWWSNNARNRR